MDKVLAATVMTVSGAFVVGLVLALLGSIKLNLTKHLQLGQRGVAGLFAVLNLALIPSMLASGVLIDRFGVRLGHAGRLPLLTAAWRVLTMSRMTQAYWRALLAVLGWPVWARRPSAPSCIVAHAAGLLQPRDIRADIVAQGEPRPRLHRSRRAVDAGLDRRAVPHAAIPPHHHGSGAALPGAGGSVRDSQPGRRPAETGHPGSRQDRRQRPGAEACAAVDPGRAGLLLLCPAGRSRECLDDHPSERSGRGRGASRAQRHLDSDRLLDRLPDLAPAGGLCALFEGRLLCLGLAAGLFFPDGDRGARQSSGDRESNAGARRAAVHRLLPGADLPDRAGLAAESTANR